MSQKRQDLRNLKTIGKVVWEDLAMPMMIMFAMLTVLAVIFLPVIVPTIIPQPVNFFVPAFTVATLSHIWLSVQYTKKYLIHRRLVGYVILSWLFTALLIGLTLWAYLGS